MQNVWRPIVSIPTLNVSGIHKCEELSISKALVSISKALVDYPWVFKKENVPDIYKN